MMTTLRGLGWKGCLALLLSGSSGCAYTVHMGRLPLVMMEDGDREERPSRIYGPEATGTACTYVLFNQENDPGNLGRAYQAAMDDAGGSYNALVNVSVKRDDFKVSIWGSCLTYVPFHRVCYTVTGTAVRLPEK